MFPVAVDVPPQPNVPAIHRGFEKPIGRRVGSVTIAPEAFIVIGMKVAGSDVDPAISWASPESVAPVPSIVKAPRLTLCAAEAARNASAMVYEVKLATGWSWDRLATAVGRTRQAVHGWTLGKEIAPANLERLSKLLAAVEYVDRGSPAKTQEALLMPNGEGGVAADYLNAGRFEDFRRVVGKGAVEARKRWTPPTDDPWRGRDHWYEELLATGGEEAVVVPVKLGEPRRVSPRRRG